MTANASYVRARIDPAIRNEAAAVLAEMGLTLADDTEIPNALTRETMKKADRGEEIHHAKDLDDLLFQLEN